MRLKHLVLPALMMCGGGAHASVNILSESKIGIGYQIIESDDGDVDLSLAGGAVKLGYQFKNRVYIKGEYAKLTDDISVDGTNVEAELEVYSAVLGRQFKIDRNSIWYGEVGVVGIESTAIAQASGQSVSFKDEEPFFALGYKYRTSKNVVLAAQVNYIDDEVSGLVSGQYNLSRHFALNAEVEYSSETAAFLLGVSYFF